MHHDANGPSIEFAELRPGLDWHVHLYMLEGFTASVRLRNARHRPEDLRVELWTNALHKRSSGGCAAHTLAFPLPSPLEGTGGSVRYSGAATPGVANKCTYGVALPP